MTHKRLHERLKPDETAEGQAFARARQNDLAANQNAQSIVIHSLHRPGAPGIDPPQAPKPPAAKTKITTSETATKIAASPAAPKAEKEE